MNSLFQIHKMVVLGRKIALILSRDRNGDLDEYGITFIYHLKITCLMGFEINIIFLYQFIYTSKHKWMFNFYFISCYEWRSFICRYTLPCMHFCACLIYFQLVVTSEDSYGIQEFSKYIFYTSLFNNCLYFSRFHVFCINEL